jgi:hypothetical protein
MSNKTTATPLEALRAHAQAAKELSRLRKIGAPQHQIYTAEDTLRKWYNIYTDPQGKGARYFRKVD